MEPGRSVAESLFAWLRVGRLVGWLVGRSVGLTVGRSVVMQLLYVGMLVCIWVSSERACAFAFAKCERVCVYVVSNGRETRIVQNVFCFEIYTHTHTHGLSSAEACLHATQTEI